MASISKTKVQLIIKSICVFSKRNVRIFKWTQHRKASLPLVEHKMKSTNSIGMHFLLAMIFVQLNQ